MWEKQIGGIVYRYSQSDAADVQERLDRESYFRCYPDELSD